MSCKETHGDISGHPLKCNDCMDTHRASPSPGKGRDVPGTVDLSPNRAALPFPPSPKSVPPPRHHCAWHMRGFRNAIDPSPTSWRLGAFPAPHAACSTSSVGRRLFSPGHWQSMYHALMDASSIVPLRAWIGCGAVGNTGDPDTHVSAPAPRV